MRRCVVCGNQFEKYVSIEQKYIDQPKQYGRTGEVRAELLNKEEYSCPYCYSADRDRMIVMFINLLHEHVKTGINFLEIAPSGALQKYLYKYWGESNLYTADLYMDDVDFHVDLQDMRCLEDDSFDFIVCSHVLEHVQDDRKAMRELNRVLSHDGLGIIIVPMDLNRTETDEAWGLSKEENIRRFGQEDHVRSYCKDDFILRLRESGFGVCELDKGFFPAREFNDNALTETSTLYLVYKNEKMYADRDRIILNYKNACEKRDPIDYIVPSGECNYWIDVCDIFENNLRIWGWSYIEGQDSKKTRLKVMLSGNDKKYVWQFKIRQREDIQENFGSEEYNYLYSGIDFMIPLNEIAGMYRGGVYILIENQRNNYIIEIDPDINLANSDR